MRYLDQIEVAGAPSDVFAYLADFSNTSEWDPGIAEARMLTDPPTALGSRFQVIALFRGKRQRFEYVVTEFTDGRRIVLHGEGEKAVSDDVIAVEAAGGRTRVTYEASIRLRGAFRVAEPFLGRTVRRMGDDALAGLQAVLGSKL